MDAKYIKRYKTKYFIESLIKEKEKLDKEGKYYDIDDLIVNIKEKEKKKICWCRKFWCYSRRNICFFKKRIWKI